VTTPESIQTARPQYTADAMRARVQGIVLLECVVQTSGRCAEVRIVRPLDPSFGLNVEAMKAAARWTFRPGTRQGRPVPVRVTMEMVFSLR
jgi:protein TonB